MSYTKGILRKQVQAHDYTTGMHKIVRVIDKKAKNTEGGAATATTWHVRTLTDITTNIGTIASLGSNKVTLPAGKYEAQVITMAYGAVGLTRVKLVNTTPNPDVDLFVGPAVTGVAATNVIVSASGSFELTAAGAIQVEHYTTGAVATSGLGKAQNLTGYDEIYTIVEFRQETELDESNTYSI
jgi:hypothetical protein